MAASTILDYKNLYFQVHDLTIIHGDPAYPLLQLLLNQIEANVSSVQCDLGGIIHGHLGLVFGPEDYEEVSQGTSYEIPLILAPLRIPNNMKIHETQRLQDDFKEARKLYIETVDIEKTLIKKNCLR